MRYIKVTCRTNGCPNQGTPQTIAAGRTVAPGIMERTYNLECESCGQDVSIERADG